MPHRIAAGRATTRLYKMLREAGLHKSFARPTIIQAKRDIDNTIDKLAKGIEKMKISLGDKDARLDWEISHRQEKRKSLMSKGGWEKRTKKLIAIAVLNEEIAVLRRVKKYHIDDKVSNSRVRAGQ